MSSNRRSGSSSRHSMGSSTGDDSSFDATSRTMQLLMQQQKTATPALSSAPSRRSTKGPTRSRRKPAAGGSDPSRSDRSLRHSSSRDSTDSGKQSASSSRTSKTAANSTIREESAVDTSIISTINESSALDESNNNDSLHRSKIKEAKSPSRHHRRSSTSADDDLDDFDDDLSYVTGAQDQVLDVIPQEYLFNPTQAEPILYYLPKAIGGATKMNSTTSSSVALAQSHGRGASAAAAVQNFPSLRLLLAAADDDLRLHRARVQAGLTSNTELLRKYQLERDPMWLSRQQRLNERVLMLAKLDTERQLILQEFLKIADSDNDAGVRGLTAAQRMQVQLARWQRALELYVYAPPETASSKRKSNFPQPLVSSQELDLLGLMDKLLTGTAEEEEMSDMLSQASRMCSTLVDVTKQIAKDASDSIAEVEDAYQIRLEAHEMFSRNAMARTEEIQNQFRINGRAALQIGNQLEFAEAKRQRCESASILIRRWWLMESLAEQEAMSGDPLRVNEEVRGVIPLNACRMDPLFTRPDHSLEAARALQQLRAVVRARGNSVNTPGGASNNDNSATNRRFELTSSLITRTSEALEQRLLNSFAEVYAKGGAYEFTSSKSRPGVIDWQEMRDLAQALMLFDSGRNLHKRYVEMVVSSRFPELFDNDSIKRHGDSEVVSAEDEDLDMDATRSKLSSLFHRVSEVCMQEFQLIAYVFGTYERNRGLDELNDNILGEDMPLIVARALCTRVIGDPKNGLQARINDLLNSVDRKGDFDTGAKKLDTFVVIHEKAAGLFGLLKDAADRLLRRDDRNNDDRAASEAATNAVDNLKSFLQSQEMSINNSHRQGYLNLELRLLHHECCASLDQAGCVLSRPKNVRVDRLLLEKGILEEYRAPVLPLEKASLKKGGFNGILGGPLKQSVLRQPLIHATDSLARARLMFGTSGETAARVIVSIYNQMCMFYGEAFLYPVVESLSELLRTSPPNQAPQLPFDEDQTAHDMGVDPAFWVGLERIHSAAKAFDRELWAENRAGSNRVWEILVSSGAGIGISNSLSVARECRVDFFTELESRGENAILRALDTLSAHIQWILVSGGEAMLATGGTRILQSLTGQSGGPYAMAAGSSLEAPNSPAVKSLTYCLRVQFVHIQAALTPQSLSAFWTALSMRLYDILVARLLQHYYVSTVGAVILARDVEALRSVSMLAGSRHGHWDLLRELLTLYMTPPDALKAMLVGPDGDINSGKGLFHRAGREQSLVFMSRRVDYRYKAGQGQRKSGWANQLLTDLGVKDPSDRNVNIGLFAAERKL